MVLVVMASARDGPRVRHSSVVPSGAMNPDVTRWPVSPGRGEQLPSPDEPLGRTSGHIEALCRGRGADLFVRGAKTDYARLRKLCAACPVRQGSLDVALADPELRGSGAGLRTPGAGRCGEERRNSGSAALARVSDLCVKRLFDVAALKARPP